MKRNEAYTLNKDGRGKEMKKLMTFFTTFILLFSFFAPIKAIPENLTLALTSKGLVIRSLDINDLKSLDEITFYGDKFEDKITLSKETFLPCKQDEISYFTYIPLTTLQTYPFLATQSYQTNLSNQSFKIYDMITIVNDINAIQENKLSKKDLQLLDEQILQLDSLQIHPTIETNFEISGAITALASNYLELENQVIDLSISTIEIEPTSCDYQDDVYKVIDVLEDFNLEMTTSLSKLPFFIRIDFKEDHYDENKNYQILKTDQNNIKKYLPLYHSEGTYYFYTNEVCHYQLVIVENIHKIESPKQEIIYNSAPIYIPTIKEENPQAEKENPSIEEEIIIEEQPIIPTVTESKVEMLSSNTLVIAIVVMMILKKQI